MSDLLHAWVLPELGVRGAAVRLGAGYRDILKHQPYPDAVGRWLGEALAAAALLQTGIKFNGRLSLQLQGGTALKLLYVESTSDGDLRGIARFADEDFSADFADAASGAVLAITLEPHRGERYQGIVPLLGDNLAETLEGYFAQSEQLPTRLLLAGDGSHAAGLLLQRLPTEGGSAQVVDPDGWNRALHLLGTVAPTELLNTSSELLLHRLFHDVGQISRDPLPLHVRCRCSRDKVADVLRRIGRDDAFAATHEHGHAQIVCEFCGRTYRFDPIEIEQLFQPQPIVLPPTGLQ